MSTQPTTSFVTVEEYLQDKPVVGQFVRQPGGAWNYRAFIGRDSSLALPSVECTLSLSAVYDKVDWE